MPLTIELLPAQQQQLQEEADRTGVSADEIVKRIIEARFPVIHNAAEKKTNGDEPLSEEERAQEERLFEQLHANMNETRQALAMRTL